MIDSWRGRCGVGGGSGGGGVSADGREAKADESMNQIEFNWKLLLLFFVFVSTNEWKKTIYNIYRQLQFDEKTRISFGRTSSSCFYSSLYINILNSKYLLFFFFVVVVDVDVVVVFAHSEKLSVRVKYTKSWKKRKKSFCCVAFSLSSLFYLLPILLLLLYIFLLLLYWGCF